MPYVNWHISFFNYSKPRWQHIRPRIWKSFTYIYGKVHGSHANTQSRGDTKTACAHPQCTTICAPYHSSTRAFIWRWRVSINFSIFSSKDSKWIVRHPIYFESVNFTLYFTITRAICKYLPDVEILSSRFQLREEKSPKRLLNRKLLSTSCL